MIRHVVCFKVKDEYKNRLEEARAKMLAMKDNIPYLISVEVGLDFLHSARSYDLILSVVLSSKEDLDRYQEDSYHCSVVKTLMHEIRESSIAVDYVL